MSRLSRCPSILDLSQVARKRLPSFIFDFLEGGIGRETALARNRESLESVLLSPEYFTNVSECDSSVEVFGRRYALPIGVSPVGFGNAIWPNADTILATVSAEANIPYVLSTVATTSIERIAEVTGRGAWFQLYPSKETSITDDLIRRAEAAGYGVLVVTLDTPTPATRERMVRTGDSIRLRVVPPATTVLKCLGHPVWCSQILRHGLPDLPNIRPYLDRVPALKNDVHEFGSSMIMPGVTGEEIRRIRRLWQGPLVLKGVLSGDMASEAVSLGADGVMVSNHGGRQFDAGPSAADALRDVAAAIGGKRPILFDGGIRSGIDVLRAKALGADMAFSGRAFFYGVAAFGYAGVSHALHIFADDITRGLKQIGCPRFQELDGRWLVASGTRKTGTRES